jgi:hypothetical protein
LLYQAWNPPAMVEMRVRQNEAFNIACGKWEILPITVSPFLLALEQPAVHQQLRTPLAGTIARNVQQMLGTCNSARCTKKLYVCQGTSR